MNGRFKALSYNDIQANERKLLWEFVLLEKMLTLINEEMNLSFKVLHPLIRKNIKKLVDETENIQKSVSQTHGNKRSYLAKFSKASSSHAEVMSSNEYTESYTIFYYTWNDTLKKEIKNFLSKVKTDYFVILDDGDELLQDTKSDHFKEFVLDTEAIMLAIKSLNSEFKKDGRSRFIETMRTDVYDEVQKISHNANKMSEYAVDLLWNVNKRKKPWDTQLLKMIFQKIRVQTNGIDTISDQKLFEELFKGNSKRKKSMFFKIVDLGFGRPRDFVIYLNKYKKVVPNATKIDSNGMNLVEKEYVAHIWNEVENEKNMAPNPDAIQFVLDSIVKYKRDAFTFDEIYNVIRSNGQLYTKKDVLDSFQRLYKIGYVASVSNQSNTQYANRPGSPGEPDFEVGYIRVHRAFRIYKSLDKVTMPT